MPTDSSSPFASWKADHAGLRVADFDAAVAWYTEKLDFRLKHSFSAGDKVYGFLSPAGDDSVSFELVAGAGAESRPPYADLGESLTLLGWHHVCFRVESVHEAVAELKRRGVAIVSDTVEVPDAHLRFAFIADPWGNLMEVMQPLSK